jgi:hypothetical protein
MAGRLPSTGSISIGQINAKEGYSATARTSMNDNLIRAFCGARANNSTISLGDARGNQVTVIGTLSRSNYAPNVTMPPVSLGSYFDAGQYPSGYPLYTTVNVDVPPTWWASINNPKNMTSTLGHNNSRTGGGTGGSKNFYSTQNYNGASTISGGGYYSGKSTGNRNGQVTLQYISLVKPNPKGQGS